MGLDRISAEFVLAEHRYRPFTGELLTIGRQTIGFTPKEALALLRGTGTPLRHEATGTAADRTVHALGEGLIADTEFFALFSEARLAALDVTDYEGAEYLHDMGSPVPPELESRFDVILNGSCMDNIFDPATVLRNTARMLRPGGRALHFEWGNSHPTAYLKYSPDWFLDYYAINGFADCKAYVMNFPNTLDCGMNGRPLPGFVQRAPHSAEAWHLDPLVRQDGQEGIEFSDFDSFARWQVMVVAEKAAGSTWDRNPIQKHYRGPPPANLPYIAAAQRFRASPRPLFANGQPLPALAPPGGSAVMRCVAVWHYGS